MTEFKAMSKRTLAEIVHFVAENERFPSVEAHLAGSFTVPEVRAALRSLADRLISEAAAEGDCDSHEVCLDTELSSRAKEIVSSLDAAERKKLLAAFGLTSK
ncbi:MAG: hypothetical protein JXA24_00450 [Proteobacteria bacterium]|nr:hypothetical protein [Pseudomonadota bacterium]